MQHKTAFGAIAAATAGMLLTASPAAAQEVPVIGPDACDTGVLSYPPGAGGGVTVSNASPRAGQTINASVPNGSFDPRSPVVVTLDDPSIGLGTVTASGAGAARIAARIPTVVQPGVHIVIFSGTLGGVARQTGVCIATTVAGTPITGGGGGPTTVTEPDPDVATPISGGGQTPAERPSTLPFTGSVELVAVAGLGAALVALGAGTVVVARRRRETPLAV